MSDHGRDKVVDCLFSGQDGKLSNVKFFRGYKTKISPDEFRKEFCTLLEDKKGGMLTASAEPPKSKRAPVDVREWIANM